MCTCDKPDVVGLMLSLGATVKVDSAKTKKRMVLVELTYDAF